MKKGGIVLGIIIVLLIGPSCREEPEKRPLDVTPADETGIDTRKIESLVGVSFKVLKTESVGYMPLHKFYWVALPEEISIQKLEKLASAVIKETIAARPKTFHSFTIHFICEDDLGVSVRKSRSFAQATFLPDGSWLRVGRIPINDYKDYKLTCTLVEE